MVNVKLLKISLKNFMCHENLVIDFSDSTTIISGPNGSGKSAVLDAIHLCLSPSFKRGDSQLSYIKSGEISSSIKLDAILNGSHFHEEIILTCNKPAERKIIYKGQEMTSAASKKFLVTTGLDIKSPFIFYSQNDTSFLTMTPSQRSHYINEFTQVNFDTQVRRAKDAIADTKVSKRLVEDKLLTVSTEIKINEEALTVDKNKLDDYKKQLKSLNDIKQIKDRISENTSKLQELNISLDTNIDKEFYNKKSEFDSLNSIVSSLSAREPIKPQENIEDLNSSLKKLEKDIEDFTSKIEKVEEELLSLESEKTKYNSRVEVIKSTKNKLIKSIEGVSSESTCPLCMQKITDDCKGLLQKELVEQEGLLSKESSLFKDIKERYESKDLELENIKKEKSNAKIKVERLKYSIKDLENKLSQYEVDLQEYNNKVNRKKDLTEKLKNVESELSTLNDKVKEQDVIRQSIENIKKLIDEDKQQTLDYDKKSLIIEELEKSIEKYSAFLEKAEVDKKAITNEIDQIDRQIQLYEEAHKIFVSYLPKMALANIYDNITEKMNSLTREVFPSLSYSLEGSAEGVELKVNNRNPENKSDSIKMCSGFENNLASIVFRIALLKMANIPLLILDEADAAASEENSKKLFSIISRFNFQLVIISHKQVEEFDIVDSKIVSLQKIDE